MEKYEKCIQQQAKEYVCNKACMPLICKYTENRNKTKMINRISDS
jgi:hypothetical protein